MEITKLIAPIFTSLLLFLAGYIMAEQRTKKANSRQQLLDLIADQRAMVARIAALSPYRPEDFKDIDLDRMRAEMHGLFPDNLSYVIYTALKDAEIDVCNGSVGPEFVMQELRPYVRKFTDDSLGRLDLPEWKNTSNLKTTPG